MKFGLVKTSLIDYPKKLSAVIFCAGCNLRCPYCHNPGLVTGTGPDDGVEMEELIAFLEKRASVLDGIVITGGEPTLNPYLQELISQAKALNYLVKLDTNGLRPDVLKNLKGLDFIAMDVKTSIKGYSRLYGTDRENDTDNEIGSRIKDSISWIISSGIDHQFRTTLVEEIVSADDMKEICTLITGCSEYRLTRFHPGDTLIPGFTGNTDERYIESISMICREQGISCFFSWP